MGNMTYPYICVSKCNFEGTWMADQGQLCQFVNLAHAGIPCEGVTASTSRYLPWLLFLPSAYPNLSSFQTHKDSEEKSLRRVPKLRKGITQHIRRNHSDSAIQTWKDMAKAGLDVTTPAQPNKMVSSTVQCVAKWSFTSANVWKRTGVHWSCLTLGVASSTSSGARMWCSTHQFGPCERCDRCDVT